MVRHLFLTTRIVNYIESGIDISNLLVLTFTKLAASEMKGRVRKALLKKPEFKDQLLKLESSDITNFDSYALSFVKKYYYVLKGVSKDLSIADGAFFTKLARDYLRDIFNDYYQNKDEEFYEILINNSEKDDMNLFDAVLNIYNKLCLKSNTLEYLENLKQRNFILKDEETLYKNYMEAIYPKMDNLRMMYEKYYDDFIILEDIEFSKFLEMREYNDIKEYLTLHETFPRRKNKSPYPDEYKELRENYKKMNDFFIYENKEELLNQLLYSAKHSHFFYKTIKKLYERMSNYKHSINLYEFNDIAKMAIEILKENPSIREEIQHKYVEILIDEYQDTSDLQEEFISLLTTHHNYMVGDVKQSIYRFRNANPDIFKEKYIKYGQNQDGKKVDMTNNFRSRQGVISHINNIFDLLMDLDFGGANYRESHHMNALNSDYQTTGMKDDPCLRVLHYDKDFKMDNLERGHIEAFIIANDIKQKVNTGYKVMDNETKQLRPCTYKDFALITSTNTTFNYVREIFNYEQIPLQVFQNESVAKSPFLNVIKNLLNLYKYIYLKETNGYDFTFSFMAVARSVLLDYSDQELFDIVSSKKYYESSLYKRMQKIVKDYQNDSNITIFNAIIDEFDVYNKIVNEEDVNDASVAIEFVIRNIVSLEDASLTFVEFVDYLSSVINDEYKLEYPGVLEESNTVTLMNIHKSKGLEYKIIYYYDLGHGFNMSDQKALYNFDNNYGFIVSNSGNSPLKPIVNYQDSIEDISERIRLFYVALTRAKEEMILVTRFDLEDTLKNKIDFRSFDDFLMYIKTYLERSEVIKEVSLDYINDDFMKKEKSNQINKTETANKKEIMIKSNPLVNTHASNIIKTIISKETYKNLHQGTRFHEILESLDLQNPNYNNLDSYFVNKIKAFINQVDLTDVTIYQEHEFIYQSNGQTIHGIMDLLLEYKDKFMVIDYKLSNASEDKYREQLRVYKNYLESISTKPVEVYLYSILEEKLVKVNL